MLPCPHCGKPQPLDATNCGDCGQPIATSESNPFGTLNPDSIVIPQSPIGGSDIADDNDSVVANDPTDTGAHDSASAPNQGDLDQGDSQSSPYGTMLPSDGSSPLGSPVPELPSVGAGSGKGSTVVDTSAGSTAADGAPPTPTPETTASPTSILGDPATATAADPAMLLPGLDHMLRPAATIQLPLGSNPIGPSIPADPSSKTVSNSSGTKTAADDSPGQVTDAPAAQIIEEQSPGSRFAQMLASVAASDRGANSTIEGQASGVQSAGALPPVPKRVVSVAGQGDFEDADYELLEEIGSGAMGMIYAARQKGVDRTVALKTIKGDVEKNHENIEKFLYEAQITGDLDHPNIVPIHELGAGVDGTLFYSMKLVKGTPWQDVMVHKSVDENLDILMKVADALSFAHSRGVIHRDLKPENVMLGDYGEVLLMDWGLAVNLNKQPNFAFGGTPAYMAPEMAYHLIPQISFTSDVYLLGAVLYQIVSGNPPHPGESAQSCLEAAARNELIPSVRQDGLTAIAVRAMATHPNQRYASVGEFQEGIRQYRRHAESVTMTRRAQEALDVATRDGDYDSFSRSIFGFQDAIDLWPENQAAIQGLAHSRIEFGRHALEDNNLQLALRVLDPGTPAEAEYVAEAKKRLRVERTKDRRMKVLRTSFAMVILLSCGGLSLLAVFANNRRVAAEDSRIEAEDAKGDAQEAQKTAETAQGKAESLANTLSAKTNELNTSLDEQKKLNTTNQQLLVKVSDANIGLTEKQEELTTANLSIKAAQRRAEANLADALNGTYQSQLGLVFAQLENADLSRATDTLTSIVDQDGEGGIQQQWLLQAHAQVEDDGTGSTLKSDAPDLTNWIYNRADLLTNRDLIHRNIAGRAVAVATSWDPDNPVTAVALQDQSIVFVNRDSETGKLVKMDGATVKFDNPVSAVEVSHDGRAVSCLVTVGNGKRTLYGWKVGAQPKALDDKSYSQIHFTVDGMQLWALRFDDAGIHKWNRAPDRGIGTALAKSDKAGVGAVCTKMMAVSRDMKSFIFCPSAARKANRPHIRLYSNVFRMTAGVPWNLVSNSATELTVLAIEPDGGHFLMGFDDGTIVRCRLATQSEEEIKKRTPLPDTEFAPMRLKPNPHFSRIHTIRFSNQNSPTMLTSSQQTDIHRWEKSDGDMGWEPLQTLLGHSNSVVGVTMSPDGTRGISVDSQGHILDWDFAEQQRRQLEMLPKGYAKTIFTKRDTKRTVDVDGDGVLWRNVPSPGKADRRVPSFFGHTPTADIFSTVATPNRKLVVTAGRLTQPKLYNPASAESPVIEVCLWNSEGNFLGRFHVENEAAEPTLSLSTDGKWLAVSGSPTTVWNVATRKEHWRAKTSVDTLVISKNVAISPLQSHVAYHGPHNISVVDFETNQVVKQLSEDNPNSEFDQIAWSRDGEALFVLDTSGLVARRNANDLVETTSVQCTKPPPGGSSWRSHLVVQDGAQSGHTVSVIYYYRNAFRTMYTNFAFDTDSSKALMNTQEYQAWRMLQPNGAVHDYAPMKTQANQQRLASPTLPFIIEAEDVFQISDTGPRGLSFARTDCLAGSSDDGLNQFASLHQNGSVWLCQTDTEEIQWAPFHPHAQFELVAVSPSGTFLATIEPGAETQRLRIWNIQSNAAVFDKPTNGAFCWLHNEDQLAFVDTENKAQLVDAAKKSAITLDVELPPNTASLIPFTEKLRVPKLNRPYLISREILESGQHELVWHRIENVGDENGAAPAADDVPPFRVSIPDLTVVTTSPVEGLLVTGTGEGSTTIWFCSPSVDKTKPREMLNLRGHMGASLTSLQFDMKGSALITSDDKLRNYVWHSTRQGE
jgi:serine/threonine protein kinase